MNFEGQPHNRAEQFAAAAEEQLRQGEITAARHLYSLAGQAEVEAVRQTPLIQPRTRGILSVSAVSLLFKAGLFDQAEAFALESLVQAELPTFAKSEIRQTLQVIWEARELHISQRQLGEEELQVSIRGSEIGAGRAPLGLVLDKVIGVRSILYRITEM